VIQLPHYGNIDHALPTFLQTSSSPLAVSQNSS
jgi:hypothetical protein